MRNLSKWLYFMRDSRRDQTNVSAVGKNNHTKRGREENRANDLDMEGCMQLEGCKLLVAGCDDGSSTSASIQTDRTSNDKTHDLEAKRKPKVNRGIVFLVVSGGLSLVLGALTIIWTPFDILMNERAKMVRGFPAYEWWRNPPDEVYLRLYAFNITNAAEFLNGSHTKLKLQEVGPYIFLEKFMHTNVTFNSNGTMTYVAHRMAQFLPELNHLSLNATLTLPNLAVLGMASYLHDASFFTKFGFNMLVRRMGSQPIVQATAYDYFWNYSDPVISVARKLAPFIVPVDNVGILHTIYNDYIDEETVYIGIENIHRFFHMNQWRGNDRFQFWENKTCDSVEGATEGANYHMFINRNDSLKYFRKSMCRMTPVYYVEDTVLEGMDVYRFELPDDLFDRPENLADDCFTIAGNPPLPSGLSDVSPCYYGFPIATSFPHFMNAEQSVRDAFDGLKPTRHKHVSSVIVEPKTGVPLESTARSQSNLVIRNLRGFGELDKFRNLSIPMFWAEYNQVGLPWYMSYLIYFTVVIVPNTQAWVSFILVTCGGAMLLAGGSSLLCARSPSSSSGRFYSYTSLDVIASLPVSEC